MTVLSRADVTREILEVQKNNFNSRLLTGLYQAVQSSVEGYVLESGRQIQAYPLPAICIS